MTTSEPSADVGLVLWSLRRNAGASSTEAISIPLPQHMTVARTLEVLREAESHGLVRAVGPDSWEMTEAGLAFPSSMR